MLLRHPRTGQGRGTDTSAKATLVYNNNSASPVLPCGRLRTLGVSRCTASYGVRHMLAMKTATSSTIRRRNSASSLLLIAPAQALCATMRPTRKTSRSEEIVSYQIQRANIVLSEAFSNRGFSNSRSLLYFTVYTVRTYSLSGYWSRYCVVLRWF